MSDAFTGNMVNDTLQEMNSAGDINLPRDISGLAVIDSVDETIWNAFEWDATYEPDTEYQPSDKPTWAALSVKCQAYVDAMNS